jgi:hypothetical protein
MSALIVSQRRFADFSARPTGNLIQELDAVGLLRTVGEVKSAARVVQPVSEEFETSSGPRGLAVKSITLTSDFRSFMQQLFDEAASVYYLAWCYDLSGQPVYVYPGQTAAPKDASFELYPGESKRYMGAGSLLFPQRVIRGGLAIRLQVWESHAKSRDFGSTLQAVCKEIKGSELNSLLTVIASGTGVAGAQVALIEQAALELGSLVGTILKASSDDFVDLYEGYFPVSDEWHSGEFAESGRATEMVFTRIGREAASAELASYESRVAVAV